MVTHRGQSERHEPGTVGRIGVECLGQSGFRFQLGSLSVFVDPYLSDRVADVYGGDLHRLKPPPYTPLGAPIPDWILLTHDHEDHYDPETVGPLCRRAPSARVVCPA